MLIEKETVVICTIQIFWLGFCINQIEDFLAAS